jgi:hypothetical protein
LIPLTPCRNVGVGMTAGLLLFPLLQPITGRVREARPPM